MTEDDHRLWKAVIATVTPLGAKRAQRRSRVFSEPVVSTSIDLHGMTVQDAYDAVMAFLGCAAKRSTVTVITGKSGQIRQEFPGWIEHLPITTIALISDGGAFRIKMGK